MMMDQKNQLGPEQKKKLDSTELSSPKKHGAAPAGDGGDTVSSEMRA
jgi:hypothetical protein